jgi:hypothetical protein
MGQLSSLKGPNYQYAQQNKATIRNFLPTWTKELENKLQSMGKDQFLDIEDSPDDLLSDGEPEQNNNRGMEHDSLPEADLDDESTLAEVIDLMAPPPEPQERPKRRIADKHKNNQKNLKARKGSRKKAKCADSDSDNDDTQPWVNDPKGFKAIGQTFQLSYITDDESDKNIQAVVVDSILWEDEETNKQFSCLDYEFSRPGATSETDFATVEDVYIAIRATLWQ